MAITVENAESAKALVGRNVLVPIGSEHERITQGTIQEVRFVPAFKQFSSSTGVTIDIPAHWKATVGLKNEAFDEVDISVNYLELQPEDQGLQ